MTQTLSRVRTSAGNFSSVHEATAMGEVARPRLDRGWVVHGELEPAVKGVAV